MRRCRSPFQPPLVALLDRRNDCQCNVGFLSVPINSTAHPNGYFACRCDTGVGFNRAQSSCTLCERGQYKSGVRNVPCQTCPVEHSTTPNLGATSIDDCICEVDYYMWDRIDDEEERTQTCESCATGMNCTLQGNVLERLWVEREWRARCHTQDATTLLASR